MPASDATLVQGVLNGDRAAYAELYDRRAALIRAICLEQTKDLHAAADLTQETFVRAFEKLGSLRDPHRFTSWLIGVARQTCREWRRKQSRDRGRNVPLSDDLPMSPAEEPDERIELLCNALHSLPDRERLGLCAFYLQGMRVEEAGAVLGLSRSGVYSVLASARRRLRQILSRQEARS